MHRVPLLHFFNIILKSLFVRFPRGIALDSEGLVYVSDIIPNTKNYRVQKFTQEGQFVTSWGSLGGDSTDLNFNEYDVAVD